MLRVEAPERAQEEPELGLAPLLLVMMLMRWKHWPRHCYSNVARPQRQEG